MALRTLSDGKNAVEVKTGLKTEKSHLVFFYCKIVLSGHILNPSIRGEPPKILQGVMIRFWWHYGYFPKAKNALEVKNDLKTEESQHVFWFVKSHQSARF